MKALILASALLCAVTLAATRTGSQQAACVRTGAGLKLPPIQKRALANGLPVWVVEMHSMPLANFSLVVKAVRRPIRSEACVSRASRRNA
jgi:hypothetical protein